MNWDQVQGKWTQVQGDVKKKWGKLTDDDLTVVEGNRDKLAGKIQERYGMSKEQADKEVEKFASSL